MKMNVVFLHYAKNTLFHLKYVQQKILNTPKRQCTDFENHRNDIIAKNCVIILAKNKIGQLPTFRADLSQKTETPGSQQAEVTCRAITWSHPLHFFTFTLWQGQRGKPLSNISQCQGENILNWFDITIKQYDHQSHSLPSLQSTPCNKSVSLIRSSIGAQTRHTLPARAGETAQDWPLLQNRQTPKLVAGTQCSRRHRCF